MFEPWRARQLRLVTSKFAVASVAERAEGWRRRLGSSEGGAACQAAPMHDHAGRVIAFLS